MNCDCHYIEFGQQTDLQTLLRHMMPYTPGIPADMALDLVRESYKYFARRTGFLVHRSIQDGQHRVKEYPLIPPDGYETYLVLGRKTLTASSWWANDAPTFYTDFEIEDNSLIRFRNGYSKDEPNGIEIYTVVIPTDCCDTIPTSLATPYGRGIALGAVAQAWRLPNQSFSSPRGADRMDLEFNRVVANATAVAKRNRKVGGLRARPVRVC